MEFNESITETAERETAADRFERVRDRLIRDRKYDLALSLLKTWVNIEKRVDEAISLDRLFGEFIIEVSASNGEKWILNIPYIPAKPTQKEQYRDFNRISQREQMHYLLLDESLRQMGLDEYSS